MNSFLAAIKGHPHETTPLWFMRQAGRYLSGYRKLRLEYSIKEICRDPDLTVQVTSEPIDLLGVDAAIIFSDITIPLEAMGFNVEFRENVGPVISNPLSTNPDLIGITDFSTSEMHYGTYSAISKFREKYPDTPIIGFSGGPLTIASYLTLGRPDKDLSATRTLLYKEAPAIKNILAMLREMVIENAKAQVKAGANAIQIFDSWAGYLSPSMFSWYRDNYLSQIAEELSAMTSTIYFSTQTGGILDELTKTGFDFISIDWRVDLPRVASTIETEMGLQGNIDPLMVSRSPDSAVIQSRKLVEKMKEKDNYIFNLGHGVLPDTDPEALREIVRTVHQFRRDK